MRCGDCRFYHRPQEECRAHPPKRYRDIEDYAAELLRVIAWEFCKEDKDHYPLNTEASEVRESRWPYTDEDEWCGEFQERG
jgi:hypothetical protein